VVPAHDRAPREQALLALRQHACTACHEIPGAVDSAPQVGPPLAGFGRRTAFAGSVPLTRDNLVRWIQAPESLRPGTAMPALGVSDTHAREIADYLLTLR
jgi:cytochrome c1